ncbi:MAG: PDZ domain-containing protein [Chitinophagaceae bacterium]|nr:PDZ domain-containing protein [Chitinophagaceae bacterium]
MKKLLVITFTAFSFAAFAQEDKAIVVEGKKLNKKETQEIVIRKKGDKDVKVTVEINGDKVTINGKPLVEFKDDDISINKRNITIFDGKNKMMFEPNDMEVFFDGPLKGRLQTTSSGAFLGVTTTVTSEDKEDTKSDGAVISTVVSGSAAEKAGLKEGDIITKINDTKISSPGDLTEAISGKKAKDEVTVTYKRDGKTSTAKATLGDRKGTNAMAYTFTGPNGISRSLTIPRTPGMRQQGNVQMWSDKDLGDMDIKLDNLEGNFDNFDFSFPHRPKIGLKIQDVEEGVGVKVLGTEEESPAEKAGLKKDDIITEINGKPVNNTDDARELLKPEEGKNAYTIKAKRNGTAMSFEVKIPKKLKTANL